MEYIGLAQPNHNLHQSKTTGLEWDKDYFVVAEIIAVEPHPNADRLVLAKLHDGKREHIVLTGAPNLFPFNGKGPLRDPLKVAYAREGALLYDGHKPGRELTKIKRTKIRGVESYSMACSEKELGISDEHEGIIIFDASAPSAGTPLADYIGDVIFNIAITPNMSRNASVIGVARELAALTQTELRLPSWTMKMAPVEKPLLELPHIDIRKPNLNPRFTATLIENVTIAPSPYWLQIRLRLSGMRPINNIVDITNYVTFDLCRPLHVFDLAKVVGNICPRLGRAGETMLALDGKTYELDGEICVIGDESDRAEGLGGVMGSEDSGCTEKTTEVFIECAYFDPVRTAITGRKLNILSDARYRFERGVDPAFMVDGMEIATRLVLEICGGSPSQLVIAGDEPKWRRDINLRKDRVKTLGGVDISDNEIERILATLGFQVRQEADLFIAGVPSWRSDIVDEACLVEEVLRIYGFDKIPVVPLKQDSAIPGLALSHAARRRNQARRALASRGMIEAVTYSFLSHLDGERFGSVADTMQLVNPISADLNVMRPSLLPNLINAVARNTTRGIDNAALFEVGPQFSGDKPEEQSTLATGIRMGALTARHWALSARSSDVFDAKADAMAALQEMGVQVENLQVTQEPTIYLHPGRAGIIRQGPKRILARFGEVHPGLIHDMGLIGPIVAFEIYLDNLAEPKGKKSTARQNLELSAYQKVERDFAFIVDETVAAKDLINAVFSVDKTLITNVAIFDVYTGKNIDDGKKSLAIAVTLQPTKATLNDTEIEKISEQIVFSVSEKTGATLRN